MAHTDTNKTKLIAVVNRIPKNIGYPRELPTRFMGRVKSIIIALSKNIEDVQLLLDFKQVLADKKWVVNISDTSGVYIPLSNGNIIELYSEGYIHGDKVYVVTLDNDKVNILKDNGVEIRYMIDKS